MSDVTQILHQIEAGDRSAADQLLPLVYAELRKLAAARMAQERSDHTLQATALVHEAYLRLVDAERVQSWESRGHFFAAAAEAMRRILIESARLKASRAGHVRRSPAAADTPFDETLMNDPDLLLDLEDGLRRLEVEDAEAAALVKLRLFGGLTVSEAGKLLGMSRSTAYENWEYVRSWFAVHAAPPTD